MIIGTMTCIKVLRKTDNKYSNYNKCLEIFKSNGNFVLKLRTEDMKVLRRNVLFDHCISCSKSWKTRCLDDHITRICTDPQGQPNNTHTSVTM